MLGSAVTFFSCGAFLKLNRITKAESVCSVAGISQCNVSGSGFCSLYILFYPCQFECVKVKMLKSGFSLSAFMDFIKLNFVNSLVEF